MGTSRSSWFEALSFWLLAPEARVWFFAWLAVTLPHVGRMQEVEVLAYAEQTLQPCPHLQPAVLLPTGTAGRPPAFGKMK